MRIRCLQPTGVQTLARMALCVAFAAVSRSNSGTTTKLVEAPPGPLFGRYRSSSDLPSGTCIVRVLHSSLEIIVGAAGSDFAILPASLLGDQANFYGGRLVFRAANPPLAVRGTPGLLPV